MILPSHEKRRHARATLDTKVLLRAGADGRSFQATLRSADVSLGGIFFLSEFALKLGSELRASFKVPGERARVEADGVVVRVEHYDARRGSGRSGFALRFTAFVGDGEQQLAALFLAPRIREFVRGWQKGRGRMELGNELDRLVDALISWELKRSQEEQDAGTSSR